MNMPRVHIHLRRKMKLASQGCSYIFKKKQKKKKQSERVVCVSLYVIQNTTRKKDQPE